MSEEATATKEFDKAISKIGDEIAGLTLTQAVDLADYMKDTYGIEPAAGGAVMMAGPAGGGDGDEGQILQAILDKAPGAYAFIGVDFWRVNATQA